MSSTRTRPALRRPARSFLDCLRHFLTPAVWKQAHRAVGRHPTPARWAVQPLLLVLLTMTWCCGDAQAERFETAKAFCVACRPKRRRPGRTVQGWQKALSRTPLRVLRALAVAVRSGPLADWLHTRGQVAGFIPLGCDGTRLACPRTAALAQRLGQAGKDGAAPTVWLTALVHLRSGLLGSWRLGKGTARERDHLRRLLPTLPARALVVADAGYVGYALARALLAARVDFLIRVSSQAALYARGPTTAARWRDGAVYCWPEKAQNRQWPALEARLLRVRGRKKQDVWLLTSVRDARRLPVAQAAQFYRWRWESEGFFRTYKRTLKLVKLQSRTVRLVHREAEGALLAAQLLLAQGALAMPQEQPEAVASPRQVLREIRRELAAVPRARLRGSYGERLGRARRERRRRESAKAIREWPRRSPHKPPKPPRLLKLTERLKARIARMKRTE
jgi:Transposase DDE domain